MWYWRLSSHWITSSEMAANPLHPPSLNCNWLFLQWQNHASDAFVLQSPLNKLKGVCLQEWSSQPKTLWGTWYSWLLSHAHKKRPWQHTLHNWQIESPVPFLGCPNEEKKVFRHCIVSAPKWNGLVGVNSHLGRFCVNPLQLAKLLHGPLKWRCSGVPSSAIY